MATVESLLNDAQALGESDRIALLGTLLERQNSLQLARTLSAIEARFGVKAAAPAAAVSDRKKEEKPSGPAAFDVVLKSGGGNKIAVIKVVRAHTTLGLKEAKELVDKGGQPVKTGLPREEADKLAKELSEAGGEAEVKPA